MDGFFYCTFKLSLLVSAFTQSRLFTAMQLQKVDYVHSSEFHFKLNFYAIDFFGFRPLYFSDAIFRVNAPSTGRRSLMAVQRPTKCTAVH